MFSTHQGTTIHCRHAKRRCRPFLKLSDVTKKNSQGALGDLSEGKTLKCKGGDITATAGTTIPYRTLPAGLALQGENKRFERFADSRVWNSPLLLGLRNLEGESKVLDRKTYWLQASMLPSATDRSHQPLIPLIKHLKEPYAAAAKTWHMQAMPLSQKAPWAVDGLEGFLASEDLDSNSQVLLSCICSDRGNKSYA